MGKTQNEILTELRASISMLREQIDIIENKIALLESYENISDEIAQAVIAAASVVESDSEPEVEPSAITDEIELGAETEQEQPAVAMGSLIEGDSEPLVDLTSEAEPVTEEPTSDPDEASVVLEEFPPISEPAIEDIPEAVEETVIESSDAEKTPEAELEPEITSEEVFEEEPVAEPVDDSFPFDIPQEEPQKEEVVDLPVSDDIDIAPVDFESLDVSMPDTDIVSIDIPEDMAVIEPSDMVVPSEETVDVIEVASPAAAEEDIPSVESEPIAEPVVEPAPEKEPEVIIAPSAPLIAEEEPSILSLEQPAAPASINDAAAEKPAKAVIDIFSEKLRWKTDMPGTPVKNIVSAISLNDRVLFVNTLFHEDHAAFANTIAALNSMSSLEEALTYLGENFSSWNMKSDVVYRFMMAVRRKLK